VSDKEKSCTLIEKLKSAYTKPKQVIAFSAWKIKKISFGTWTIFKW